MYKKSVLIIGGTGNISREITKIFIKNDYDVTVVNRGNKKEVTGTKVIIADVTKKEEFFEKIKELNFDCVIDMLCYKLEDAIFSLETWKNRCKHLIVCSSIAAYKRPFNSLPITEDMPLWETPDFPYGYNKANIERYLMSNSNGFPITIIRPSLTFGKGCKNVGVLRQNENIMRRILNNKPLISFGLEYHPFTMSFSPDVAEAFYLVALNPKSYGKTYHINNGRFQYFDDLYKEIGKILGKTVKIYHLPVEVLMKYDEKLFEHIMLEKQHLGYLSIEKFQHDFPQYKPKYDIEKGARLLIDDWKERKEYDDIKEKMEDELCSIYESLLNMTKNNVRGAD